MKTQTFPTTQLQRQQFNPTQFRVQPRYPGLTRILKDQDFYQQRYRNSLEFWHQQRSYSPDPLGQQGPLPEFMDPDFSLMARSKSAQQYILLEPVYETTQPTTFNAVQAIPNYVDPTMARRGVWKSNVQHKLRRGFCPSFLKAKSFNHYAGLTPEELAHAQEVLTLYKYFTRNSETDMRAPIDRKLLTDRKFVNIAEGFLRKKALSDPKLAQMMQVKYTTGQSKQGLSLTLSALHPQTVAQVRYAFQGSVPIRHRQQTLTSIKDQRSKRFGKKDDLWYDRAANNPGQLGEPIKIHEHKTQTKPAVLVDRFDRDQYWQQNSPQKKSRKKKQIVTDPSALGPAQLKRLNKNMVTIELTKEQYEIDEPEDLGGSESMLRQSDATFGAVDQKSTQNATSNLDLSQFSSLLDVKIPKSSHLMEAVLEDVPEREEEAAGKAQIQEQDPNQELEDEMGDKDLNQQLAQDAQQLRARLYQIFKRDEEILKLMANVPKSWLQEEIDDISEQEEQPASPGQDDEDEEAQEVDEDESELAAQPKGQKLVNIHVKMERDRGMYNRTDGTSLEATRVGMKDEGSVRRGSGEEDKEDMEEEFDLRMEESGEADQMLPHGGNAAEDSILSISYGSQQMAEAKKDEGSQMADMSQQSQMLTVQSSKFERMSDSDTGSDKSQDDMAMEIMSDSSSAEDLEREDLNVTLTNRKREKDEQLEADLPAVAQTPNPKGQGDGKRRLLLADSDEDSDHSSEGQNVEVESATDSDTDETVEEAQEEEEDDNKEPNQEPEKPKLSEAEKYKLYQAKLNGQIVNIGGGAVEFVDNEKGDGADKEANVIYERKKRTKPTAEPVQDTIQQPEPPKPKPMVNVPPLKSKRILSAAQKKKQTQSNEGQIDDLVKGLAMKYNRKKKV